MNRLLIALSACAVFATSAHAGDSLARLGAVTGDVLVSGEKGFATAKTGSALKVGDRVVAKSGAVDIAYADGCKATVKAGAMATITAQSPCAGGPGIISAGGSSAQLGLPNWPFGAYVAGAGVLVIVGAIGYGLTDPTDEDEVPVSE